MVDSVLSESYELSRAGEPFALVSVVQSRPPTSAKPGNRAIVRADGTLSGWIGGGCSQSIVIKEGLRCLQEGQPRLVSIRNEEQTEHEAGVVEYAMLCPSGGAMDLYIQPFLPQPHLLILGSSPVAQELSQLASHLDFAVAAVQAGDTPQGDLSQVHIPAGAFVVVATMGKDDEAALALAAASEAAYVGFVASRKKMSVLADHLREQGVPAEELERIKAPAGLDIKAGTPAEIALSILAEIVLLRRSGLVESTADDGAAQAAEALVAFEAREAQDPVCGMLVDTSSARHIFQHNGHTYYFCCEHCQRTFEKEPAKFIGEELS